jgi:hypothetical protein
VQNIDFIGFVFLEKDLFRPSLAFLDDAYQESAILRDAVGGFRWERRLRLG